MCSVIEGVFIGILLRRIKCVFTERLVKNLYLYSTYIDLSALTLLIIFQ